MPRNMTRRTITLASADAIVTAARERAGLLSVAVNVAVVDDSGLLVAFCRMDGAERPSGEIAVDKAYTAAGFGFPTHEWRPSSRMIRASWWGSRPEYSA